MKKLAIVLDSALGYKDGVNSFVRSILPLLCQSYEVTVITPFGGKSEQNSLFKHITVPSMRWSWIPHSPIARPSAKTHRIVKHILKNTDLVWIHAAGPLGILAHMLRKDSIAFFHVFWWEQIQAYVPIFKRTCSTTALCILRYLYNRRSSLVMIPYATLKEKLCSVGIIAPMVVTPLGIDETRFIPVQHKDEQKQKLGISPGTKVIGYVGRVTPEKDIDTLLEAFRRIQGEMDIKLLLVGNGNKITEEGVITTGFVENVIPYLQAMDVFVMPSLTETTSLATLEAMACGIPVIATRVGFIPEYVNKGVNGYLFEPKNVTLLTIQLRKVLTHEEHAAQLGHEARKTAEQYSLSKSVHKIQMVLENVKKKTG